MLDARAVLGAVEERPAVLAHAVPAEALADEMAEFGAVHLAADLLELVEVHLHGEALAGRRDAVARVHEVPVALQRAARQQGRGGQKNENGFHQAMLGARRAPPLTQVNGPRRSPPRAP